MKKNDISQYFFAFVLIVLGILFRTAWHLAPNVEFVTAATILASTYLGKKWSFVTPLVIMILSDLVIGNTNIFLFTWSAYLFIGCLSNLSHLGNLRLGKKMIIGTGLGIIASLWFYLWTNFGVWALDSFGMYPKTLLGLIDAYILGLPFFKNNLIGNLLFVPISLTIVELIYQKIGNIIIYGKKLKKYEWSK